MPLDKAGSQKCIFEVKQNKVSILQSKDEQNWQNFTDITDKSQHSYFRTEMQQSKFSENSDFWFYW